MNVRLLPLVLVAACDEGGETNSPPPPPADSCSTRDVWSGGSEESPLMHPGGDCIGCHADEGEGPGYVAAGTVMGAYDEPTDCMGVEGVTVRVTDALGDLQEAVTNAAGNFWFTADIAMPFTAEIEAAGMVRAMLTPQSDANCTTCHTEVGLSGAPGRILAPE